MAEKKTNNAPKKAKTALYAVMTNGEKYRVTRQDGKYLYCEGGRMIRHQNLELKEVTRMETEAEAKTHGDD